MSDRKEYKIKGLEDRQRERERRAKVKELTKAKQPIPPELQQPIVDREKVWKTKQEEIKAEIKHQEEQLAQLARDQQEEKEEEDV